jgi:hypothetical protein
MLPVFAQQEALLEERQKLQAAIDRELKGKGAAAALLAPAAEAGPSGSSGAASMEVDADAGLAAEDGEDALDAFMSNVEMQLEQDKARSPLHICMMSQNMG